jgi:hypothetical protein
MDKHISTHSPSFDHPNHIRCRVRIMTLPTKLSSLTESMKFEAFAALSIYILLFWIVTPCSLVGGYQHSGGITASIFDVERVRSKFLLDVGNYPHDYTESQPRTSQFKVSLSCCYFTKFVIVDDKCEQHTAIRGDFTGGPNGNRTPGAFLRTELESYQFPLFTDI